MRTRRWLIGFVSVTIAVLAWVLTRSNVIRHTFPGGSTYRGRGIDISFPETWKHNNGQFEIAGKFRGEPIVAAWEGTGSYGSSTAPGVTIQLMPTHGARSSRDFADHDRKALNSATDIETGPWKLEQTSAQFLKWRAHGHDYFDVFVISPKGQGWSFEFYSPDGDLAAHRPVFEQIVKTVRFD